VDSETLGDLAKPARKANIKNAHHLRMKRINKNKTSKTELWKLRVKVVQDRFY
jgi:hypothetical protein